MRVVFSLINVSPSASRDAARAADQGVNHASGINARKNRYAVCRMHECRDGLAFLALLFC